MTRSEVLVSIRCLVYNHEPYLRQCLDGFVMQKTNFAFEAIVHDDASTDGTAAIVKEYAEKYPDIIKPIFETENQYSKRDGSIRRIMNDATSKTTKYIAFCEGDDYWTDPLKLQKQFDFMEANPDYSLCFHPAYVKFENGIQERTLFGEWKETDYNGLDIIRQWTIPTASVFFRAKFYNKKYFEIANDRRFIYGDIVLFEYMSTKGRIKCINEVMSVYRRNAGGVTEKDKDELSKNEINHYKAISEHFKVCRPYVNPIIASYYLNCGAIQVFKDKNPKGFFLITKSIRWSIKPAIDMLKRNIKRVL